MGNEYEVNGTATIRSGTGAAQALQDVGISYDGVTVATEIIRVPIHTDEYGGPEGVPAEFQYLGELAHIRAELIYWDPDVLSKLLAGQISGTWGTTLSIGQVLGLLTGANAAYHRLAILCPGATITRGFDWPRAFLKSAPRKIGTRVTRVQCEWYAWQGGTGTGTSGAASGTVWMDRNPTA